MIRFKVLDSTVHMRVSDAEVVYSSAGDPYTGSYTITPKVDEQTMATRNKLMQDNVTIKAIPYYETDNNLGTTIYIGSEL